MDKLEFVRRLKIVAYESVTNDAVSLLKSPPGRAPSPALCDLSQWFNSLSSLDQARIREVVELAARHSLLTMLCILDGVVSFKEQGESGNFELSYKDAEQTVLINDGAGQFLHDLFAAEAPSS